MSADSLAPLILNKNEDRRLRAGHLWVFSNEVDQKKTPLKAFEPGQPVEIRASGGKPLGSGYVNPHSLIAARLVSRDPRHPLNGSLIVHRLKVALSLRQRLYPQPFYRLIFGESDGLPGLVVDRYGDCLVAQITTAGMERMREEIVAALEKVLKPEILVFRNDLPLRELEGLEKAVDCPIGELPETVEIEENGARFQVPIAHGQKTGWFYDQRENRAIAQRLAPGARVLDVFSYIGGWGIQAASAGAREVICVDSSQGALHRAEQNAALNGVADRVSTTKGDAFEILVGLREEKQRFDLVIVDPPAFIKRRKDAKQGLAAYRHLNQLAIQVLARDGLLVSASCSYHLPRSELSKIILQASRHLDRNAQTLFQGHQAPDHPVHPAIPESEYLKAFFTRILPV